MEHKRPNQQIRVLEYLKTHRRITQFEAIKELGILRLASRIYNLQTDGYVIDRQFITVKNRFDENCRVMKYSYDENKNENSHCLKCGSLLGKDCGDAEADYNDYFCSKLCNIQWRK